MSNNTRSMETDHSTDDGGPYEMGSTTNMGRTEDGSIRDHAINVTITVFVAQLGAAIMLFIGLNLGMVLFLITGLCVGIGMTYVVASAVLTEVDKMIQQ